MTVKVKTGMGGSRCGKGRREGTAFLKEISKRRRRRQGHDQCVDQQFESPVYDGDPWEYNPDDDDQLIHQMANDLRTPCPV